MPLLPRQELQRIQGCQQSYSYHYQKGRTDLQTKQQENVLLRTEERQS